MILACIAAWAKVIGGTLCGCGARNVRSPISPRPGPAAALAGLVVLFAFLSFATLRLNFGVFALFLTGYVVFLLVLAGLAAPRVAEARIESTLIGAAIALAAHVDFYVRFRAQRTAP